VVIVRVGHAADVPIYRERHDVIVAASPQACFDALIDVERLPSWQQTLRAARVIERDERGRPGLVEFEVDARVRRVRYRIRQIYDEPHRISSEYVEGDFRDFTGEWRFTAHGADQTLVALDLGIDPGRFVPGPLRSLIADAVMRRALADLKAHVERDG
jgi:ribosome-associated toxin RatA of RatAB toxin-antitoxin module